jgi:hypothetical protein
MITDKEITDIIKIWGNFKESSKIPGEHLGDVKRGLKEKGYEVEEEKNKLELVREYYNIIKGYFGHDAEINKVYYKYEEAVAELQEQIEQMKCCGNCKYVGVKCECEYEVNGECDDNLSMWEPGY